MPRTITLLTSGTLGDVLPFVALGRGLVAAGVRVRIATHAPFAPLVRRHGLVFAAVDGSPNELLQADPEALTLAGGPLRAALASWRFVRAAQPVYGRMLASAWAACRGSDALVAALPTWWGLEIAESLGVPCVLAPLQPLTPTRAWPSALLPLPDALGPCANVLSHRLLAALLRLPWRAPLARWRREVLGLLPARRDPLAQALAGGTPFVYGFSPWLAPRPPDWPERHVVAGFWRLDADPGWRPPDHLRAFLEAGPQPVYVGFGSMGAGRPAEDARLALEALAFAGYRGVLPGGGEVARLAAGRRHVCAIESAPHGWLMPHMAAAVHHGGAGTTAASLGAGLPTVTVPFAADQYFWGRRVAALGAGPPPVPRHRLTSVRLADLIRAAAEVPTYRRRAAALGVLLRQERGVERAVEIIRALL
jgi:sterol 3beta-glucosyltransferase